MKNNPKTRYPLRLEESYAKNIQKAVKEIEKVSLYEFDKYLAPMIDENKLVNDSKFIQDGLFDAASKLIKNAQTYFLGILHNRTAQKIVRKYINSVNAFNKSNVNSQLSARGINQLQTEKWLDSYVQAKIAENISYVTNIRDDYSKKFEQVIYRGITEGKSSNEIREELVRQAGMSSDKAAFIARDQTGTILGQMNSERQKRAGFQLGILIENVTGRFTFMLIIHYYQAKNIIVAVLLNQSTMKNCLKKALILAFLIKKSMRSRHMLALKLTN